MLGPERPRLDATCRFCLKCSTRSDRLVPRSAPRLERQRTAARSKRLEQAERERTRERERTEAYYTVGGVNLLAELKVMWASPVAKEWRARRKQTTVSREAPVPWLKEDVPKLEIKRFTANKLGHANYFAHEIVIFRHGPDHDAVATLLHEVAHILVGPRQGGGSKRQHHGPAFRATLKTLTQEYNHVGR